MPDPSDLDRRRALLTAALGFALLETQGQPTPPEQTMVKQWLDNWTGVGHVVTGMHRQGYDLELSQHADDGWRATFFVTGRIHSFTGRTGTAWEPTPVRAVQLAAWEALTKTSDEEMSP